MYEWHRLIQVVVDEIDKSIEQKNDENLSLEFLSSKLGYSVFHTTRKFKELSGISFRDYLRLRRLAYALVDLRDTEKTVLNIAVDYGFSSHEAFTRAFKSAYGITPKVYRGNPMPVVLRTKINTFDRYLLGIGEIGMVKSSEEIKIYYVSIPAHKFLHVKNYDSEGYFDFWKRQVNVAGCDCDTICGLLDSITGKLDGDNGVLGKYSGHVMGYIFESGNKCAEAYGVRLPVSYSGIIPKQMLCIDIPEAEYIVFEHGPFDYDNENTTVGERLENAVSAFDFFGSEYILDETSGRISYFYHAPEKFEKIIKPVKRR